MARYENAFKFKNDDVSDVNVTFDDDDFWPWPYMPEKITDVHYAKDHKVVIIYSVVNTFASPLYFISITK